MCLGWDLIRILAVLCKSRVRACIPNAQGCLWLTIHGSHFEKQGFRTHFCDTTFSLGEQAFVCLSASELGVGYLT